MTEVIEGSCHCGRIRLQLEAAPTEALSCNCSHCSRKGYLLTFVPRDQVKVDAKPEDVGTYTFNKHVIRHHFCRTCGCAPFADADRPEGATAAVNLRCFEIDLETVKIKPFDGRSR